MITSRTVVLAVLFLVLCSWFTVVEAVSPPMINYQGKLLNGTNLVSGQLSVVLRVYTNATTGDFLFEDSNDVIVVDGLYSTQLGAHPTPGSGTLTNALAGGDAWIEVEVNGTILSPREQLLSVAYALNSDRLGNMDSSAFATGTPLYAFTETDPVWATEKSGYATGTPIYAYTETDPVWAAASNGIQSQITSLDTAKVSRTGDTMTGALNINAGTAREIVIGSSGTNVAIGASANGLTMGVAVGRRANGANGGVAVGTDANGYTGAAVGWLADGSWGVAVGNGANGNNNGTALGWGANAIDNGTAAGNSANGRRQGAVVGDSANGYFYGAAVGTMANAKYYGAAVGSLANADNFGVSIGGESYGGQTNVAIGYQATALGGSQRIAIGLKVTNAINDSVALRGTLYLDGGTGIYYRTPFGSGGWNNLLAGYLTGESDPIWNAQKSGYATGTPLYAFTETDPVWAAEKSGYATGTPLYAFTETDPRWTAASNSYYQKSEADGRFVDAAGDTMTGILTLDVGANHDLIINNIGPNVSIGNTANGSIAGAAVGDHANGYNSGAALGRLATADAFGTAVGYGANGRNQGAAMGFDSRGQDAGAVVGYQANAANYGATIGRGAFGYNRGATVGANAQGQTYGAALGAEANGMNYGAAVGYLANASGTNIAAGYGANAALGLNRIAIGQNVTNSVDDSAAIRGTLYIDGGTAVYYRTTFGSGGWVNLLNGLATGTPLYAFAETDPVWLAEKSGYATGTPLYAFTETDPVWTAASNNIQTQISAKLDSNTWATAGSTTNYVRRTGDTMTGALTINSGAGNVLAISNAGSVVQIGNSAIASINGAAVGCQANGTTLGTALGYQAIGSANGAAVGYQANGDSSGASVGYQANGNASGVGVGREANGNNSGAAVGRDAMGASFGAAVGSQANAFYSGVAVGSQANGTYTGVAVGQLAVGSLDGTAVGLGANGMSRGVAVGQAANGANTNLALGFAASAGGGIERIAIGHEVTNVTDNSAAIRGTLYLDGGTGLYYRSSFGSGGWVDLLTGLATGTPLYAFTETDPIWTVEKSGYATGTPLYAFTESDPVWAAEKAGYATGTPLYAFTETDPIWTLASNGIQSQISNLDTAKVSKTGDTMTGNLTINGASGLVIDSTNSNVMIGRAANAGTTGVAIGNNATGLTTSVAIGNNSAASSGGAAVGASANAASSGAALGPSANAYDNGVAIGNQAGGSVQGVAIGVLAGGASYGTSVGGQSSGSSYGTAVGWSSRGSSSGAAVGSVAHGVNYGSAVGYSANGDDNGAALGASANAWNGGVAIGYSACAASTNIAIGYQANAGGAGATNRIAIGRGVINSNNNSAAIRGTLYLDGGTGILYRSTFGSGGWVNLLNGLATGTPLYAETDPVWSADKAGGFTMGGDLDMGGFSITNIGTTTIIFEDGTEFSASSVQHWNTAYGWGDHAAAGYATGTPVYAEADPVFGLLQTNGMVMGAAGTKRTLLQLRSGSDQFSIEDTDGPADENMWLIKADNGALEFVTSADSWGSWSSVMSFTRDGATPTNVRVATSLTVDQPIRALSDLRISGEIKRPADDGTLALFGGSTWDGGAMLKLGGNDTGDGDVLNGGALLFLKNKSSAFRVKDRESWSTTFEITNNTVFAGGNRVLTTSDVETEVVPYEFGVTTNSAWKNNTGGADFEWDTLNLGLNAYDHGTSGVVTLKVRVFASCDGAANLWVGVRNQTDSTYPIAHTQTAGLSTTPSWWESGWTTVTNTAGIKELRVTAYTDDSGKWYYIKKAVLLVKYQKRLND